MDCNCKQSQGMLSTPGNVPLACHMAYTPLFVAMVAKRAVISGNSLLASKLRPAWLQWHVYSIPISTDPAVLKIAWHIHSLFCTETMQVYDTRRTIFCMYWKCACMQILASPVSSLFDAGDEQSHSANSVHGLECHNVSEALAISTR